MFLTFTLPSAVDPVISQPHSEADPELLGLDVDVPDLSLTICRDRGVHQQDSRLAQLRDDALGIHVLGDGALTEVLAPRFLPLTDFLVLGLHRQQTPVCAHLNLVGVELPQVKFQAELALPIPTLHHGVVDVEVLLLPPVFRMAVGPPQGVRSGQQAQWGWRVGESDEASRHFKRWQQGQACVSVGGRLVPQSVQLCLTIQNRLVPCSTYSWITIRERLIPPTAQVWRVTVGR